MKNPRYPLWRTLLSCLSLFLALAPAARSDPTFPGASWETVSPKDAGWNAAALETARQFADKIGSSAVMIVQGGKVVASWGDVEHRFGQHSVRKSFLSSLYGIYASEGKIDLNATLAQLGIDDKPPGLTDAEKQARVVDLLSARSGVYHVAAYETDEQAQQRPARGSHPPGTFWYYNNWDFNALGAIFKQLSGVSVYEAFDQRIARPIGMQDYRIADGKYVYEPTSIYPAYTFQMSARDDARFGLLYLHNGNWNGRQVVSRDWVATSTASHSTAGLATGYGYLWWTALKNIMFGSDLGEGSFSAWGAGGVYIVVSPVRDLVIVHVGDQENDKPVSHDDFKLLLAKIVAAAPTPPQ